MTEREDQFFERAEKILTSLEKTKIWYKSATIAFILAFLVFISASGVVTYRLNKLETGISNAVSRKSFELIQQSIQAETDALVGLIENKDHREIAKEFNDRCRKINDNIFMFATEVNTRGGKVSNDKGGSQ